MRFVKYENGKTHFHSWTLSFSVTKSQNCEIPKLPFTVVTIAVVGSVVSSAPVVPSVGKVGEIVVTSGEGTVLIQECTKVHH